MVFPYLFNVCIFIMSACCIMSSYLHCVCLPVFCLLYSFFISSLERVKKQLKSLAVAAGHPTWRVINLVWLLAGPTKLPSAEILAFIEEEWGQGPVHPSIMTYSTITSHRCDTDDPADKYVW
jgi:hypothetical protein